jgi:sulfate permease, SulP family
MAETARNLNLQGFSTKGLAGDLSAGLTKSIDSVTGGMANAVLAGNKVAVLYAYGSLFFAGARNLEEDLPRADETRQAVVILSLRGHTELGSTFMGVLERYAQALQANGNTLMLVGVSQPVYEQLEHTGFLEVVGEGNVFLFSTAGEATRQAYEKAQQLIQA